MRLGKSFRALILGLVLVLVPPQPALAEGAASDIAEGLICQCGCTLVLQNCTHIECDPREAMMSYIQEALDRGESSAQIVAFFVSQYGEQVLSSPPKKGFNLMAWVTPFAALILGGGVVYLALKKWVRRGEDEGLVIGPSESEDSDGEYRERLEQELSEFSEGSFR